jgi:uncharacterized RDD family membrane protein YckC
MNEYPTLFSRYFASLIDMLLAFSIAVIIGKYLLPQDIENDMKIIFFTIPFLLYEPFFTAYLATLGQLIFKFRVRQLSDNKKLPLWKTYIRYIVKIYLGLISVLTIPARVDRRAIHDLLATSIVKNI